MAHFFAAKRFAVVGASADPTKYGNTVLRWYQQHGVPVTPVNPNEAEIEGLVAVPHFAQLGGDLTDVSLSVITPPHISLKIVQEALELGVNAVWLQPGAEDSRVRQLVLDQSASDRVILGGPCILVTGAGMLDQQRRAAAGAGKL